MRSVFFTVISDCLFLVTKCFVRMNLTNAVTNLSLTDLSGCPQANYSNSSSINTETHFGVTIKGASIFFSFIIRDIAIH